MNSKNVLDEIASDPDIYYCPSPAEIRAACEKIQDAWSERERARRLAYRSEGRHCVSIAGPGFTPFHPKH